MGTRDTDRLKAAIQPTRTLAETFSNIARLQLTNGEQIDALRGLIPGYVHRMTIEDILASPDELPHSFDPNDAAIFAYLIFGKELFQKIIAISKTPDIWQRMEEEPRRTYIRPLIVEDAIATPDMDTVSQQLFFIVNQGREVYTLLDAVKATFDNNIPIKLKRILSSLKAVHLDTPINSMPDTYRRPEVNEQGQEAIEWLRPKVASFVLTNDPPQMWLTQRGTYQNRPADIEYLGLDPPEIYLKKPKNQTSGIAVNNVLNVTQRSPSPNQPTDVVYNAPVNFVNPQQPSPIAVIGGDVPNATQRSEIQNRNILMRRFRTMYKPFRLSSGEVRRLARRGGVKRISGGIRDAVNDCLKTFVHETIKSAFEYAEHASRKTVTLSDIMYALKHIGRPLYL